MSHLNRTFAIDSRRIGPDEPCYIIAEAGVNHNGDIATAIRLIDVAADAGADAVKFQTFKAELLATEFAPKAEYQSRLTGGQENQQEMLKRLELPYEDHATLRNHCIKRGITFLSTPFDEASATFLSSLGVPAFKVSSGDLTNLPFLRHLASFSIPVLISTGMSTMEEVEQAVEALEQAGCRDIGIFHCVSCYPALPAESNLRAMDNLKQRFQVPCGYSDHTEGLEISVAATALGASMIEKHFTLDRTMPGPDHQASLQPDELTLMIRMIRSTQSALGDGRKVPQPREAETAKVARKGVVAKRAIKMGQILTADDLAVRRPEAGLRPDAVRYIPGKRARRAIAVGEPISAGDLIDD
jgi:N,N'-diacetyllegionaminate synthase